MLNSTKFQNFSSFSITGNLRATVFVKKDDIYKFKKFDDLMSIKENFDKKYLNNRKERNTDAKILALNSEEVESPEKKHYKSKSVGNIENYYKNSQENTTTSIKLRENHIESSNKKRDYEKYQNFIYENKGFDLENFKVKNWSISSTKKKDIHNEIDQSSSGREIINFIDINNNKDFDHENNRLGNFSDYLFKKEKISLKKIEPKNDDAIKLDCDSNNSSLENDSYSKKLENLTLLNTLENLEISEETGSIYSINENSKIELKQFNISNEKHKFSNKINYMTTSSELIPDEIYTTDSKNYFPDTEIFKTKKNKDYLDYKTRNIESTNVPERSFQSNNKYCPDQNSEFILDSDKLWKTEFYGENKIDYHNQNFSVTREKNLEKCNYLNSVSNNIEKDFRRAYDEVQNIKRNFLLTEEEFKNHENKSLNEINFSNQSDKDNNLNYLDNAINNVNLNNIIFNVKNNNENENFDFNKFYEEKSNKKNLNKNESFKNFPYNTLYPKSEFNLEKNENFINRRNFLQEKENKQNNINSSNLIINKMNFQKINLSKFKIKKEDIENKECQVGVNSRLIDDKYKTEHLLTNNEEGNYYIFLNFLF